VVVETQHHTLVYDAGPKLSEQTDAGENVVLPFLRARQIKKIDRLVISHGDNDHIGGAGALLRALPVTSVLTSVPEKIPQTHAAYCLAGYRWQWEGVHFEFFYPSMASLGSGNDSSCVLRIDNGQHSVLLPGDIERVAENILLQTYPDRLQSEVLIAPHHGSKTSDVSAFIQAVHPQYVLYATGYQNRYHFPHREVVLAYSAMKAIQMDTAEAGAITFKFPKSG